MDHPGAFPRCLWAPWSLARLLLGLEIAKTLGSKVELLLDLSFKPGDQGHGLKGANKLLGDSLLSAWCVVDGGGEAMSLPLLLEVLWLGSVG